MKNKKKEEFNKVLQKYKEQLFSDSRRVNFIIGKMTAEGNPCTDCRNFCLNKFSHFYEDLCTILDMIEYTPENIKSITQWNKHTKIDLVATFNRIAEFMDDYATSYANENNIPNFKTYIPIKVCGKVKMDLYSKDNQDMLIKYNFHYTNTFPSSPLSRLAFAYLIYIKQQVNEKIDTSKVEEFLKIINLDSLNLRSIVIPKELRYDFNYNLETEISTRFDIRISFLDLIKELEEYYLSEEYNPNAVIDKTTIKNVDSKYVHAHYFTTLVNMLDNWKEFRNCSLKELRLFIYLPLKQMD